MMFSLRFGNTDEILNGVLALFLLVKLIMMKENLKIIIMKMRVQNEDR